MVRITDGDDPIAGADRAVSDRRRLLERAARLQQRQIVVLVRRYHTQQSRTLASQVAMDLADALADDMIVRDHVTVRTNHEAAA